MCLTIYSSYVCQCVSFADYVNVNVYLFLIRIFHLCIHFLIFSLYRYVKDNSKGYIFLLFL
jgi:hypothetical protein